MVAEAVDAATVQMTSPSRTASLFMIPRSFVSRDRTVRSQPAPTLEGADPLRKLEIPTVCDGRCLALLPEPVRELGAGAHAELPVGARQGALDGVLGDEQGGRHLAVRAALGDQRHDSALGLGQLAARGCAAADPPELGARLLGPKRGAEPFEDRERLPERQAGGAALLRSPLGGAECEEGARVL